MKNKKVLIAVGGTGGHIYPATSLGKELVQQGCEVKFVGGALGRNRYFDRNQYPYQEVTCGFISTKNPFKLAHGAYRIGRGVLEGRKILKDFKPDLVVGFGSYYTFPVLSAAKMGAIPIVLHEQNAIPGRVNKLLSPYVQFTAISIPDASKMLSGEVVHVEMPLNLKHHPSKTESLEYFNLDVDKKTLLIFGGSQGADSINLACLNHIKAPLQVIHFTGNQEMTYLAKETYSKIGVKCSVKDFEHRMDYAWTAGDFAITRSGASTIAEAIEYEVPLIMIPFPQAMDNHQEKNADFMIKTVGGGVKTKVLQGDIIQSLPIESMKSAIKLYKLNSPTPSLCSLVIDFLNKEKI